jgi:hypothetical protein
LVAASKAERDHRYEQCRAQHVAVKRSNPARKR